MWKLGNASLTNEGVKEMTQEIRMFFFSRSAVSDYLRHHEPQHTAFPCFSSSSGFVQVHVHCIGDAIQLSHPLMTSSPANVGNLISAFSKPSLGNQKFLVCVMLRPSMQDFKHELISMGDECNILIVWTFFRTALLGNWDEDWPFPVPWPLLGFPDLWTYWVQHFDSIIF